MTCSRMLRQIIDKEELDRACKMHGREEECILGFGRKARIL
jgi:hypothetical protein